MYHFNIGLERSYDRKLGMTYANIESVLLVDFLCISVLVLMLSVTRIEWNNARARDG